MPLIVLSGPEKAGKSTTCEYLASAYKARVRHWGMGHVPPDPANFHTIYLQPLIDDIEDVVKNKAMVVWDRSWACEVVYSTLLNRGVPHTTDGWLMEWLYGRAVRGVGTQVMLLGPTPDQLRAMRTTDDHKIDPADERNAYWDYAYRYNWHILTNPDHQLTPEKMGDLLARLAWEGDHSQDPDAGIPPAVCGPDLNYGFHAPKNVLMVGESRNKESRAPGAWLPFTSNYTTQAGRSIGPAALQCRWTNADEDYYVLREEFTKAGLVVAYGREAAKVALDVDERTLGGSVRKIINAPHPAYAYRWGNAKPTLAQNEAVVRDAVLEFFKAQGKLFATNEPTNTKTREEVAPHG